MTVSFHVAVPRKVKFEMVKRRDTQSTINTLATEPHGAVNNPLH